MFILLSYFLKSLSLNVLGTDVTNWWDNGDKQIAFCREGRGFAAFNDQYDTDLKVTLQVNMAMKSNRNTEFR
jgi:alpha-amylase